MSFAKKKKAEEFTPAVEPNKVEIKSEEEERPSRTRRQDTTVEYKPFDQKKGRVTARNKVYEEIEDDDLFESQ